MNRGIKRTGFAVCSLALLLAVGGHWVALQSVAWGRMLIDYSRTDSFGTAVRKTFDGEHPCTMCLQIKNGREQAEREQQNVPWIQRDKAPDLFFENRPVTAPSRPGSAPEAVAYIPQMSPDYLDSPPTPPPRA